MVERGLTGQPGQLGLLGTAGTAGTYTGQRGQLGLLGQLGTDSWAVGTYLPEINLTIIKYRKYNIFYSTSISQR